MLLQSKMSSKKTSSKPGTSLLLIPAVNKQFSAFLLILSRDPCTSCLVAMAICWRDFWVSLFSSLILNRNLGRGGSSVSTGSVLLTARSSSCATPTKDKERSSSLSRLFSSLLSLPSSRWFGWRWSIAEKRVTFSLPLTNSENKSSVHALTPAHHNYH